MLPPSLLRRRHDRSLGPMGGTPRPHDQERIHSDGNRSEWEEAAGKEGAPARSPGAWGQGDRGAQESKGSVFTPEAQTLRDSWRPF